jgi:hypothetical protein
LTLIVPDTVTVPLASNVTGVLAAFLEKVTVTPEGILTVVKLKTPFAGSVKAVLPVGAKAPSAPVLPLLKVWADTVPVQSSTRAKLVAPNQPRMRGVFITNSFGSSLFFSLVSSLITRYS